MSSTAHHIHTVPAAPRDPASTSTEDLYWRAVETRDPALDGTMVYAVATTGIFCKPSCSSRRPLRSNVSFFSTAQEAQQAGFRPCLRCKPMQQDKLVDPAAQAVRSACQWLQQHRGSPASYTDLAARAGMGAAHFHRAFKRIVGVTPKRYADGLRLQHFKSGLRQAGSITDQMYDSGFSSSSRLYERTTESLGMTPGQYRSGGAAVDLSYVTADTAMGRMLLAATDRGICFLQFAETDEALLQLLHAEFPQAHCHQAVLNESLHVWLDAVRDYLSGAALPSNLPLDSAATAFQMRVWDYLQTIPAGQSRSYSQAAAELGRPSATRAVASACARNRIALLIPCHRVLRSNGDMGGYRWGVDRKKALLALEQRPTAH